MKWADMPVNPGDTVKFRGDDTTYVYRGLNSNGNHGFRPDGKTDGGFTLPQPLLLTMDFDTMTVRKAEMAYKLEVVVESTVISHITAPADADLDKLVREKHPTSTRFKIESSEPVPWKP